VGRRFDGEVIASNQSNGIKEKTLQLRTRRQKAFRRMVGQKKKKNKGELQSKAFRQDNRLEKKTWNGGVWRGRHTGGM